MGILPSSFSKVVLSFGLLGPISAESDTVVHDTGKKAASLIVKSEEESKLRIGNWYPTDEQKDALRPFAEKLASENNLKRVQIGSLGGYEGGIILIAGKDLYYFYKNDSIWVIRPLPLEPKKKTRRGAIEYLRGEKEGMKNR